MEKKDACALTPPMGWNSWDCYAATVTEAQLLRNAEYMSRYLAPFGWEYMVCDIQWYEPLAGTGEGEYRPFADLCMDSYSRLVPAENRFPSAAGGKGFAPIAETLHGMGLKFGIHIMRGIPRQAVHSQAAVQGAGRTACAIANPFSICKWNSDMYGVDATKPGAGDYYNSLFELYASWGVDYVKVDDICNTSMYPHAPYSGREEIELIRQAIDRSGRPMVLSLSPGPAPFDQAGHLAKHANMWRITDDFWDRWDLLKEMFRRCGQWQGCSAPGAWPDCDMLPLGRLGMGFRRPRSTNFTPDEQRLMMTLWCIFRSPLMMGGELPGLDEWTLSLLTNTEVLDVLRQGSRPRCLFHENGQAAWTNQGGGGTVNVALFNLGEERTQVVCPLALVNPEFSVETPLERASVRDLWAGLDLPPAQGSIHAELAPHSAALFRLAAEQGKSL